MLSLSSSTTACSDSLLSPPPLRLMVYRRGLLPVFFSFTSDKEGLPSSTPNLVNIPLPVPRRCPALLRASAMLSVAFARKELLGHLCLSAIYFNEAAGFPLWYGLLTCTSLLLLPPLICHPAPMRTSRPHNSGQLQGVSVLTLTGLAPAG